MGGNFCRKGKKKLYKKIYLFKKILKEKQNYDIKIKKCENINYSCKRKLSNFYIKIKSFDTLPKTKKKNEFFEKIKNTKPKKKQKKLDFFSLNLKKKKKKVKTFKINKSRSIKYLKFKKKIPQKNKSLSYFYNPKNFEQFKNFKLNTKIENKNIFEKKKKIINLKTFNSYNKNWKLLNVYGVRNLCNKKVLKLIE